jgi:carotenoid cleavage dioxygenase
VSSSSPALTQIERLTGTAAEFPRIDDRFAGVPYRHGWLLEMDLRRPVTSVVPVSHCST